MNRAARGAAALLLLGPAALAAQPADDSQTPASSVPGAESPRIHSDGRVTFELHAPDARSIQVAGGDGLGKGPFPMTKGADGTWSVTIPPPVPGSRPGHRAADVGTVASGEPVPGAGPEAEGAAARAGAHL